MFPAISHRLKEVVLAEVRTSSVASDMRKAPKVCLETTQMFPAISHPFQEVKQADARANAVAGDDGTQCSVQIQCTCSRHGRPGGLKWREHPGVDAVRAKRVVGSEARGSKHLQAANSGSLIHLRRIH